MAITALKYNTSAKGFQYLSTQDITDYLVPVIGSHFASNTSVGSLAIGSMANGTSIGTWVDTYRTDSLGSHPVNSGAITTNSTTLYQDLSNLLS